MRRFSIKNNVIYIIVVLLITLFISNIYNYNATKKHLEKNDLKEVKVGLDVIKKLESKSIIEIEKKINNMNKKKYESFKEAFSNSVIMGDSISESLIEYKILNESSVVAYKGRNINQAKNDVDVVVNLYPSNIYMAYGMNDTQYFRGKPIEFIRQYEKVINDLMAKLPESNIYISEILPVQQKAKNKVQYYYNIDEFNLALKDMCNRLGITYVHTEDIVEENMYEPDGVHMKKTFYKFWLKRLLQESNIYSNEV